MVEENSARVGAIDQDQQMNTKTACFVNVHMLGETVNMKVIQRGSTQYVETTEKETTPSTISKNSEVG